jgi:hypothetical protein
MYNGEEICGGFAYYDADEADEVIAELKEKHKTEVKELLCLIRDKENNFNRAFDSEEKEIRHQKYKRCLAMAGWCEATALWCYQAANTLPTGFHATLFGKPVMIEPDRLFDRFERLIKWSNRWMNLANKFKEAK